MKRLTLRAETGTPGLLFLTESIDAVAYNWEAVRILAFPSEPKQSEHLRGFLAKYVRSRLTSRRSSDIHRFVREFKSGNRRYTCRALSLCSEDGSSQADGTTTALLLERRPATAELLMKKATAEFRLTQRESQCVALLLQGMTTKEIAQVINLSPNTVKSFLRLIMAKMDVSTRSGVVGKILFADLH
ncbi:MAG TPA: helix-turn-helix transcriptional regulator [Terriglobales bacterium]